MAISITRIKPALLNKGVKMKSVSTNDIVKTYASLLNDLKAKGKISEKEFKTVKNKFDAHYNKNKKTKKPSVKKCTQYLVLDNIVESNDKKHLVFNFKNNTSFTYNLITKKFRLKGNINIVEFFDKNKMTPEEKSQYSDNRSRIFFTGKNSSELFMNSTTIPWIKTFFAICKDQDINILHHSTSEKTLINRIEIISKIEKFQNLKSFNGIDQLIRNSKFKTSLKDLGLDNWFIESALKNGDLWRNINSYQSAKKQNLTAEFQFVWEKYSCSNTCSELHFFYNSRIKNLIENHNYEFKTLIEYLNEGMHNQGIRPLFEEYNDDIDEDLYYYLGEDDSIDLLNKYVKFQTDENYEKYPRNLTTEVAKAYCRKKIIENQHLSETSKENFEKLKSFEFEDDQYCVIAPQSIKDIIDEGRSLKHCIANYAKNVAKGHTKVVFMRNKSNKNSSLLTILLSGTKKIKTEMVRGNRNRYADRIELSFLTKYNKHLKTLNLTKESK